MEIKYIRLRPGEKKIEALFSQDEYPRSSEHEKIMIINNNQTLNVNKFRQDVNKLVALAHEGNKEATKEKLMSIVRYSD